MSKFGTLKRDEIEEVAVNRYIKIEAGRDAAATTSQHYHDTKVTRLTLRFIFNGPNELILP
jgi:hypothetical protein